MNAGKRGRWRGLLSAARRAVAPRGNPMKRFFHAASDRVKDAQGLPCPSRVFGTRSMVAPPRICESPRTEEYLRSGTLETLEKMQWRLSRNRLSCGGGCRLACLLLLRGRLRYTVVIRRLRFRSQRCLSYFDFLIWAPCKDNWCGEQLEIWMHYSRSYLKTSVYTKCLHASVVLLLRRVSVVGSRGLQMYRARLRFRDRFAGDYGGSRASF